MTITREDDREAAATITNRLAEACTAAGLMTEVLASVRVRVRAPGAAGAHLAEVVSLRPDREEVLCFWWSWGQPICHASDITRAVESIAHVVAPTIAHAPTSG